MREMGGCAQTQLPWQQMEADAGAGEVKKRGVWGV